MTRNDQSTFQGFSLGDAGSTRWDGEFATELQTWSGAAIELSAAATHYIFVWSGSVKLEHSAAARHASYLLQANMYASLHGEGTLQPGEAPSAGIVISRIGYHGVFQLGGPIEARGRLRYIDGCTDSLLLAPPVCGDPCLNHLHIPAGTKQSAHTHPSLRVGIIVRGTGTCVTPTHTHALRAGMVFVLQAHGQHSFHTDTQALDVVVYHPDSDTGPSDEDHPMINRTFL